MTGADVVRELTSWGYQVITVQADYSAVIPVIKIQTRQAMEKGHDELILDFIKKDILYYFDLEWNDVKINGHCESIPTPEYSTEYAAATKIVGCSHPNKYINHISANLKFMVCPDCKMDLGDVE